MDVHRWTLGVTYKQILVGELKAIHWTLSACFPGVLNGIKAYRAYAQSARV